MDHVEVGEGSMSTELQDSSSRDDVCVALDELKTMVDTDLEQIKAAILQVAERLRERSDGEPA